MAVNALHLGALTGFAIAQVLFELLASNAQFFAYRRSRPLEIVLLAGVLILAVPCLLIAVETLGGWVRRGADRWLHLLFVAILVMATALPVINKLDIPSGVGVLASASGLGAAAAFGYARVRAIRQFVTLISPCMLLFPALFLLRAPVKGLVFPSKVGDPGRASVAKSKPVPIVMVVFDELSLVSLLDERHQIDAVRFPNFAALADQATWYRQATTVADNTEFAIPAILTGRYPVQGLLPRAADYPESLFTLLARTHRFAAFEPVFRFCPEHQCDDVVVLGGIERVRSLLTDVAILYLHVVTPSIMREDLPSIDAAWGNFADARRSEVNGSSESRQPGEWFTEFIASVRGSPPPTLHYLHSFLPHVPWRYLPSGRQYAHIADSTEMARGLTEEEWAPDALAVAEGAHRYLLQAGFTDRLLGQLIARMKALRMFDEALIVITADHGVSFAPGGNRRRLTQSNYSEIAAVPLIIKAPLQSASSISDRNVESVDILPTMASMLGVTIPWKIDGRSALDTAIAKPPTKTIWYSNGRSRLVQGPQTEGLYEANRRFRSLVGSATPVEGIRVGPFPALQDRRVSEIPLTRRGFRVELDREHLYDDVDPAQMVPVMVKGTIHGTRGPQSLPLAVAVNGVIRATTRTFRQTRNGEFSALLPESAFVRGSNEVQVFVVLSADGNPRLAAAERQSGDYSLAPDPTGRSTVVVLKTGAPLLMTQQGTGFVEQAEIEAGGIRTLIVSGWAANMVTRKPPDVVVVFEDARFLGSCRPEIDRHDIALRFQNEALLRTGFSYTLPITASVQVDPARVRVFAVTGRRVFEVPRRSSLNSSR